MRFKPLNVKISYLLWLTCKFHLFEKEFHYSLLNILVFIYWRMMTETLWRNLPISFTLTPIKTQHNLIPKLSPLKFNLSIANLCFGLLFELDWGSFNFCDAYLLEVFVPLIVTFASFDGARTKTKLFFVSSTYWSSLRWLRTSTSSSSMLDIRGLLQTKCSAS